VTAGHDGKLDVYADGTHIGGSDLPDLGINGCAEAELRFGADQDAGQRINAELDRSAIFPRVLPAADLGAGRSSRSAVDQPSPTLRIHA
jgi:hypothetical protein